MRAIRILPSFERDWRLIPPNLRQQLIEKLPLLQERPQHPRLDIKKLQAVKPFTWRMRIGYFRLFYRYDKDAIYLLRFLDRKDAYR